MAEVYNIIELSTRLLQEVAPLFFAGLNRERGVARLCAWGGRRNLLGTSGVF